MNQTKKVFFIVVLACMLSVILSACGTDNAESNQDQAEASNENNENIELGDKDIKIPHMDWSSSRASTHVVKAVLEDVGYNVEIPQVATGPMFASVADGSSDAMTSAWLPKSEKPNWEKFKDDLIKVQNNLEGTPTGYTVPEYMDIESTEDLKNNEELGEATDWKIYGIEPGTGTTEMSEQALVDYELDKWELVKSSETAMLSVLKEKIEEQEPVIVVLWKPHYAFGNWDLRMLEDPEKSFGEPDNIETLVRKGLEEDSPAAYQILENFKWNEELMSEVLVKIDQEGMDPEKAAEEFVEEHKDDVVKEWTSID